jgi:hypothetical protein
VLLKVIDVDASLLQNVITFPPSGSFVVNSSINVQGSQRTSFEFESAVLKRDGKETRIPPFGKGW